MDLLSKLPSLRKSKTNEAVEPTEAELKADRIKFHATSVRNGPTNFKTQTNGQARRAWQREQARSVKKTRRRQVQTFLAARNEAAVLRAHLQGAGLVPFVTDFTPSPVRALADVVWIVRHFGEGDETGEIKVTHDVVINALQSALNRHQSITGQPATTIPTGYELPIEISA